MYKGALTSDDQQPILPWSHGHTKAPQYIMQLGLAHADAAYIRACSVTEAGKLLRAADIEVS